MRELVVDLTPCCINRTAIHHIAVDTYAALDLHFDVTPQYLGLRLPSPKDRAAEIAIAEAFAEDVPLWATHPLHLDEDAASPRDPTDQAPRLYFDPIYTLYRSLHARDVVFVLDMSTLTNPEWHPPIVSIAYERAFRKLLASTAMIVCISDHCAAALRASFAIPQSDIVTVPLYLRTLRLDAASAPVACLEPHKFFLFVGSLETRKNLIGLMRAFALSGLAAQGWKIAIAGDKGQGHQEIIEAAGALAGVEILGFVSDGELAWLYDNAAAFAYPSFLEGFGLPLLEAMARGLPCLASITGASREVCGNLGILVDPYHVPSIVDGLLACARRAETPDAAGRARLIRRASQFSFQRYMDALMPVFATADT